MNAMVAIQGAKKGGSAARQPVESPDSLQSIAYAKILLAVSEGEIGGPVNGLQSIYLDGTPLQSADGSFNFQNVRVQMRSGTQDQESIAGFPDVENEIAIGVELTSDTPVVRTVSGAELSSVRIRVATPTLQKTDTTNGDITGYRITYAVDIATDGGAYSTVLTDTISGKTTSLYERSRTVDLPPGSQWQIRIRRLTPNANSSTIGDVMYVQAITEIIDAKLRYPNTALLAIELDASQFQAIPTVASDNEGRIIQVPSNYNADTRTYSGIWDGTFKSALSDNPAWVFFDIVTQDRFGMGNTIPMAWVDRWRLYQIAQYCDELVSDGFGGMEPRFTCNVYLQTKADAWRVLQDLAAVFRGVTYYAQGQVLASADMPMDPVYSYTKGNVIDGKFTYSGSARKTRYTVALVSWNDPADFGKAKVEPVQYLPGIAKYGVQEVEVTAFGCTSRSQAQRVGNHILLSNNLETETVSFGVGLEGTIAQPGQIIEIANPDRAGRRNGGRIRSSTGQSVVIDAVPADLALGDSLRVLNPSEGRSESRTITAINGQTITVSVPFSQPPRAQSVWLVENSDLALETFKVLSVAEGDGITYQITALKHVRGKFAFIDSGTKLELQPVSIIPPSVQPPPTNVRLSSNSFVEQGIAQHVLTIAWDAADKAIAYDVEWRRDDMSWVKAGRATTTNLEVRGVYAGQYLARVRAVNAMNAVSMPAMSVLTQITGKTEPPPALASLTATGIIFGIELAWSFKAGATDTQRTEIWYSSANNLTGAIKLGDFAYPQAKHTMMGLAAGVRFFFWGRLVDRSGNVGAWYPITNGVSGVSSTDANAILNYLTGKITSSQLGQDLLSKVNSINGLLPLIWVSTATYSKGQTVIFDGKIYSWENATPGNQQPPGANWKAVGDAIAQIDAVVGQVSNNTQSITLLDQKVTAQGTKVDGVFAQLDVRGAGDSNWGAGSTNVYAGTITVQSVIASADLAQAIRTDTVEANLGATNAAVQVTSQAVATLNGKASASYIVRTAVTSGGQYYAAGIALGIDASGGTVQSSFLVHADTFGVLNSTGVGATVTSPFTISGGQVFIRNAVIQDGSITNAKIGDVIQSAGVGANGQPRWKLDKNGTLSMNGANNGGFMTLNEQALRFWNAAGTVALFEAGELL
ncbi:host specificity protein J [Xanthomonas hortorum pv. gardneri]|uniref:host specificity protein J n=1 Tax=Xanthomonas hortorum TaxID=56454 RepID=UPI001E30EB85|nr:host specificity protein J [Xanthomonas hortorum]MCC8495751.1 host specificity protein J [Xanthomonas hortorum pv. gardneri]MCE4529681.1 host specificity protein J [Xanthomonas hortorum pv. vitians]